MLQINSKIAEYFVQFVFFFFAFFFCSQPNENVFCSGVVGWYMDYVSKSANTPLSCLNIIMLRACGSYISCMYNHPVFALCVKQPWYNVCENFVLATTTERQQAGAAVASE